AATLARGKPHEQATAIAVLGDSHVASATPALAAALFHPYPLVRYHARRALEKVTGAPVPINLEQDAADIQAAVAHWLHPDAPPPPRLASPRAPAATEPDED